MKYKIFTVGIISVIFILIIFVLFMPSTDNNIQEQEIVTIWDQTYGGNNDESGSFVLLTENNEHLILGSKTSTGTSDTNMWLVKVDDNGEHVWNKTFGGLNWDMGKTLLEIDGNYFILGTTNSFGHGKEDIWLIKIDNSGKIIWNKTYGGAGWELGNDLVKTSDNGLIITGGTASFGSGGSDIWLFKVDEIGREVWNYTFGGSGHDEGKSLEIVDSNNYIICGSSGSFGSGQNDIWLIKVDESGNEIWNYTFGSNFRELPNDMIRTSDGFCIAGHADLTGEGNWTGIVIKTNNLGVKQWETIVEMDKISGLSSIVEIDDGFLCAGYIGAYGVDQDCLIVKISKSGEVIWKKVVGSEYMDAGVCIQKSGDNYFVAGYKDVLEPNFSDFWLFKFSIEEVEK